MIKHLVLWKLKDEAHGNPKAVNARIIKDKLEAMRGLIPGMKHIEVGIDWSGTEMSADVALYSEFESKEALATYQAHPAHQEVVAFLNQARLERRVCDYDV